MAKKKKEVEEVELRLTDAEIWGYEKGSLKMSAINKELVILELEQQNHQLRKDKSDLEIKLSGHRLVKKRQEASDFKTSHQKFNNDVLKRLGLESGTRIAYDPISGEVDPIKKEEDE